MTSITDIYLEKLLTMSSVEKSIAIAKKVLELIDLDDYEGILNLGNNSTDKISKSSKPEMMKKAYLKLSLVIHPDRLGKSFAEVLIFELYITVCNQLIIKQR